MMECQNLAPKNDRHLWFAQVFLGIMTNANIMFENIMFPSVYIYRNNKFDSTHWINTIILFAGLAPFVFPKKYLQAEVAIVMLNIVSMCICAVCGFSDILSWMLVTFGFRRQSSMYTPKIYSGRHSFLLYQSIDLLICTLSIWISYKMVRNRIKVSANRTIDNSVNLHKAGVIHLVVTVVGIVNHLIETFSTDNRLITFISGTSIDEVSWILINLVCATLTINSIGGNYLLQLSAFTISGILIPSSLFYTFLDFKIIKINVYYDYASLFQGAISFVVGFVRLVVVLVVFLLFAVSIKPNYNIVFTDVHRKLFRFSAIMFLLVSIFLSSLTIIGTIFPLFEHSVEEELSLLISLISIYCFVSSSSKNYFIPLIVTIDSGISIFSFFLLRYAFFLFFPTDSTSLDGFLDVLRTSSRIIVTVSCLLFIAVLIYFIRSNLVTQTNADSNKRNALKIMVNDLIFYLLIIGFLLLFLAVSFTPLSFLFVRQDILISRKPPMYYFLFGITFSTAFDGIRQIIFSRFLTKEPLIPSIMLVDSVKSFFKIITRIDYSDHGIFDAAWRLNTFFMFLSLFACLANVAILLNILKDVDSEELQYGLENPTVELEEN